MKLQSLNEWVEFKEFSAINESFNSRKLSELHQIIVATNNKYGRSLTDLTKIWNAFPSYLNMAPSEITDDQVRIISGDEYRKDMKHNPNSIYFFTAGNELLQIFKGKDNLYIRGHKDKSGKSLYAQETDSKDVKNNKITKSSGYSHYGSGAKSDITGTRRLTRGRKTDMYIKSVKVYVIASPTDLQKQIVKDLLNLRKEYGVKIETNEDLIAYNKTRYKKILQDRVAQRRVGTEFDKEMTNTMEDLKNKVEEATKKIFEHPEKYESWDVHYSHIFGSGSNQRSVTTGLLALYLKLHEYYDKCMKLWKDGEDHRKQYEYNYFIENKEKIKKVLQGIEKRG